MYWALNLFYFYLHLLFQIFFATNKISDLLSCRLVWGHKNMLVLT